MKLMVTLVIIKIGKERWDWVVSWRRDNHSVVAAAQLYLLNILSNGFFRIQQKYIIRSSFAMMCCL